MRLAQLVGAGLLAVALAAAGCDDDDDGDLGPDGGGELNLAICDPSEGPFSVTVDNPFFPLPREARWVLEGEEDGTELRVVSTVLEETEVVAGVETRILEERETEDGEIVELSHNYFAQAPDGTVCYFGEDVTMYEDGEIVGSEGAWRAGESGNRPGIIMPADPQVGDTYRQEVAPGVAEDRARVVARGESFTMPAGTFTDTVRTIEDTPLEPGVTSEKVYAADIGIIMDDVLELTEATLAQ